MGEAIEQLGQVPKQTVKQTVKLPADVGKGAVEMVVGGGKRIDPLTGLEVPSPRKLQKLKKRESKMKTIGITQARQAIFAVKPPQELKSQISAYIAGKPGFSPEKMVEREELGKKGKEKLPPPVSASKPKWGTAERKLGISG